MVISADRSNPNRGRSCQSNVKCQMSNAKCIDTTLQVSHPEVTYLGLSRPSLACPASLPDQIPIFERRASFYLCYLLLSASAVSRYWPQGQGRHSRRGTWLVDSNDWWRLGVMASKWRYLLLLLFVRPYIGVAFCPSCF